MSAPTSVRDALLHLLAADETLSCVLAGACDRGPVARAIEGIASLSSRDDHARSSFDGLSGATVEESAFPPLAEVLAFAARQGDAEHVTDAARAYSRALSDVKSRPPRQAAAKLAADDLDLVAIAGEPLLAGVLARRLRGAKAVLLEGTRSTFGGASAFESYFVDEAYELVASDDEGELALFILRRLNRRRLPVHFFTIVLNGKPFIDYHEKMLATLEFGWHWHIIEGVASLVKDTAWSVAGGGHIPDDLHRDGRSIDGTSEYLDDVAARYPDRVSIYRKPLGKFWDGKLEMVSAPLSSIAERCLLWQIDADELWSTRDVRAVRDSFLAEATRTAAFFWCDYYVGPNKGISTRYNYAQNPKQEWLRVWRFAPGMFWEKHEPPVLAAVDPVENVSYDVGSRNPFTQDEMEQAGVVFDHFAYATAEQARFKESYYGYDGAVERWRRLQTLGDRSHRLREFFPWVHDDTMFDSVARLGWQPLARLDAASDTWHFRTGADDPSGWRDAVDARPRPRIVVDGVFFQIAQSGIARLWRNLLAAWVKSGFAAHVVVLDRGGTAPRIDGVVYRSIARHPMTQIAEDAELLQWACDEEGASLFLSTYYTAPTRTPSVFMGYDMIPEAMGFDLTDLWWQQKRRAIEHAVGHTMISNSSADELVRFHPSVARDKVLVAYCAVDPVFLAPAPAEGKSIAAFRTEHGIRGDYVLLVGDREGWKGYKNGNVVYAALAEMASSERPLLVCVGGAPALEPMGELLLGDDVRVVRLGDDDLRLAYAGALAFVCPSHYEGFGLPVAEAMAVGCPVITCRNTSIPEVAGEAAIYFDPRDPAALAAAIRQVKDEGRRAAMIEAGRRQVRKFDQDRSAQQIADFCLKVAADLAASAAGPDAADDIYGDLRRHETSRSKIKALESALADSTIKLSQQNRFSGVQTVLAAPSSDHLAQMAALERRLALATAELHRLDGSRKPGDAPPGAHPATRVEGLDGFEGPFPDQGILREFRWQTADVAAFHFKEQRAGSAILDIEFANIAGEQEITIAFNGVILGSASVASIGWQQTLSIRAPVTLLGSASKVEIAAGAHVATPDRNLFLAIYRVRLVRRKALLGEATPDIVVLQLAA